MFDELAERDLMSLLAGMKWLAIVIFSHFEITAKMERSTFAVHKKMHQFGVMIF